MTSSWGDKNTLYRFALIVAWGVSMMVSAVAFVAWASLNHWRFDHLTVYRIFPLLGLLAFSLMWVHYVVSALRRYYQLERPPFARYYSVTGWLVLVLILLHPGLLVGQLWLDGFGLPPDSYLQHFVAPSLGWVATLGPLSLGVFLVYELQRLYRDKPWWKWMNLATEVAMLAIFYHGLRLGDELQHEWFKDVWLLYGVSLFAILMYLHVNDYSSAHKTKQPVWPPMVATAVVLVAGLVALAGAVVSA